MINTFRWPVLFLLLLPLFARAESRRIVPISLSRPEGDRQALVYAAPPTSSALRPLVLLLHGHGGSAAHVLGQERQASPLSVWLDIADRENLIVVAPDGTKAPGGKRGWNDGRTDPRGSPNADDLGFLAALIDREIAVDHADPDRIYVMGMSNGGMMALRLAIDLQPRLAAVAAVSSSQPTQAGSPKPNHPLSVLLIAGTADPVVPYGGGTIQLRKTAHGTVLGAEATLALWREVDGLDSVPPRTEPLPHADPDDPTRATRIVWGENPRSHQVELIRIDKGGHVEPSRSRHFRRAYLRLVGPQNKDVETAEEAWTFFRDKTRTRPSEPEKTAVNRLN